MADLKLSLVVATVGRTDQLTRLIESLAHQRSRAFELIFVDQNPDDRVVPYVAQAMHAGLDVQHLRMSEPNLSAARNLGLARATGHVVGFPDDDCWYEPDVVDQVLQAFKKNPDWVGVTAQWVEQAQSRTEPFETGRLTWVQWRQFRGGDASSISLFLRRERLQDVGGFDERMGVGQWYGAAEEIDLLFTLLKSGAVIVALPTARVHHRFNVPEARVDLGQWRGQMRRARGTGALYAKHRLPAFVVVRGLLAPVLKSLAPWRGVANVVVGAAVCWGRMQGFCRRSFERS